MVYLSERISEHPVTADRPNNGENLCETTAKRREIGFPEDPLLWKTAPAHLTSHTLEILGQPVMEDWERPYMQVLAEIATSRGGEILEVGYGMGISAEFIQKAGISKHTIIEANLDVLYQAKRFKKRAKHPIKILGGFWEELVNKIPDSSFDGILFDTYPLTPGEMHKNHFPFFPHAYRMLKSDGVFTYYSDERRTFSDEHIAELIKAGFTRSNISGKVVAVEPPYNCLYWQSPTILAPVIRK